MRDKPRWEIIHGDSLKAKPSNTFSVPVMLCLLSFFVSGRKKTATAKRQLRSYESIISFHVLRAEPGAYLSPSLHLRPEIAPPFICSDLEYRFIVAQHGPSANLRTYQENARMNLPVRLLYAMICRCAKGGWQVCSILLKNPRLLAV